MGACKQQALLTLPRFARKEGLLVAGEACAPVLQLVPQEGKLPKGAVGSRRRCGEAAGPGGEEVALFGHQRCRGLAAGRAGPGWPWPKRTRPIQLSTSSLGNWSRCCRSARSAKGARARSLTNR